MEKTTSIVVQKLITNTPMHHTLGHLSIDASEITFTLTANFRAHLAHSASTNALFTPDTK